MKEVQNWLKEKDYDEGVKLYCRIGSDSFLKSIFESGDTFYTRQKLLEELSKFITEKPISPVRQWNPSDYDKEFNDAFTDALTKSFQAESTQSIINEQCPINTSTNLEQNYNQNNFRYLKLCKRRDELNRQISRNMVLLDETRSKSRRHETAKQILSLDRKKREIWAEIDYYTEHGELMPVAVKKEPKTDEIQRLYVQIYKAEKRLQKTELRNREKTEKLLNDKRARLEKLKAERSLS